MKTIVEQSEVFAAVVSKLQFDDKETYKKSRYVIETEHKGFFLLFNTLSRELIALEENEYKRLSELTDDSLLSRLVEKYFYVPIDYDEHNLYEQIYSIVSMFNTESDIFTNFTVMPTMECNARCFYCFEHGSKRYPMSDKTANDVADFIIRKSGKKAIEILWFGGEPLYNTNAIDIITKKLSENNIEFKSKIISNGYLFDNSIAIKAKKDWKLSSIQITLDGTEQIYNNIKSYIYHDQVSPFNRVLANIETALKNNIKVLIRLNMSLTNKDDLNSLVEMLFDKFKNYKSQLCIYVWLLYDNRGAIKNIKSNIERHNLTNALIDLEEKIYANGFGLGGIPNRNIKINMCGADSGKNITILPNGSIGKCDHYSDDKLIGDIYNDDYDSVQIEKWKQKRADVELCKMCPIKPQCVKLINCPELGDYDCDKYEQKRIIVALKRQIKNAFDKHEAGTRFLNPPKA